MKNIFMLMVASIALHSTVQAQFGKDLINQVKRKAQDKVSQKANESVDKAADKAEEAITKKGKKKKGKANQASENPSNQSAESNESYADQSASSTQVTQEGTAFVNNKLTVNTIAFDEKSSDFNPNPNPVLNGIGATLQQKLKKEKVLIKIYQRTSGDNATKAEEEFMAIKMYLVNRFDLNEDRIYFSTPVPKKAGTNRTVEFIIVPDNFMYDDASKY